MITAPMKYEVGDKVEYGYWEDKICDCCGNCDEQYVRSQGVIESIDESFIVTNGGKHLIPDGHMYKINGKSYREYVILNKI